MKIIKLNNQEQQLRSLLRICREQGVTLKLIPSSPSAKCLFVKIATDKMGFAIYDSLGGLRRRICPIDMPLLINLEEVSFSEIWKSELLSLQAEGISMILIGHQLWLSFFADEVVEWNHSRIVWQEKKGGIW